MDWLNENKEWVFSGIGILILTILWTTGTKLLPRTSSIAAPNSRLYPSARLEQERLRLVPKQFVPAYDLKAYFGGFDVRTMQPTSSEFKLGVNPAALKIVCYNLMTTPVII